MSRVQRQFATQIQATFWYLTEIKDARRVTHTCRQTRLQDANMAPCRQDLARSSATAALGWHGSLRVLNEGAAADQCRAVNSQAASPRLQPAAKNGLNVIAVGGLALSRGLTLEGL